MITRLTKEEYRKKRRELLTDIVYAITHDELKKMYPEHTELTPVEIYLSARAFAEIVLKLSDIDEGLDDEISDLQEDCKSEDEAMIILIVASIILEAMNKKNPSDQISNIILYIFTHTQDNPLFQPLLDQFADKEAKRKAQGKIINWVDYELQEMQTNNEEANSLKSFAKNALNNATDWDYDTIKHLIVSLCYSNLYNDHIIDEELKDLYKLLKTKSKAVNIEELVLTKHVQTQIGTVESGGTGNINNTKSTQL